jgi:hypothetical protein
VYTDVLASYRGGRERTGARLETGVA